MRSRLFTVMLATVATIWGMSTTIPPAHAEGFSFKFDLGDLIGGKKKEDAKKSQRNGNSRNGSVAGSGKSPVVQEAITVPASWRLDEKVIGPAPEPGTIYWLSPKGMHLAVVFMKGSRFVVAVDGVEGEKFNAILNVAVGVEEEFDIHGLERSVREKWRGPVAFSPDGSRYAYVAREGKDAVVILDGKELLRVPYQEATPPLVKDSVSLMSFTPDGKHLFFYDQNGRLMMDGKPVTPELKGAVWPFFSADGSRWGVLAEPAKPFRLLADTVNGGAFAKMLVDYMNDSNKANRLSLFIDGKEADYVCQHPRFTLDGKHIVCIENESGEESLLVDGKTMMSVRKIEDMELSPNGDIGVIASDAKGNRALYINGQPAPGSEDAWHITFSPDGKHWATANRRSHSAWVVVDGQKQLEYGNVSDVAFTPDSSKCVYVASSGEKKFVVVNGEEGSGAQSLKGSPVFGESGGHVGYCAVEGWNKMKVYHDGKAALDGHRVSELTLSPDGSRHAYYDATSALSGLLVVDGAVGGGGTAYNDKIFFSPDSQHVAAMSSPLPKGHRAIYRDGKFVSLPKGANYVKVLGFTSDSQRLLIRGSRSTRAGFEEVYYLDGHLIAALHGHGVASGFSRYNHQIPLLSEAWEMQPDGSVVIIGHELGDNKKRGAIKRITITPKVKEQAAL